MSNDEDRIEELIEASSLGTPTAKALRNSVSDEDVQRILDRVNEIRSGCAECGHTRHYDEPACGFPNDSGPGFCDCPVNA